MKQQIEIAIKPDDILSDGILKTTAANQLKISQDQISAVIPVKRAIDARSKKIVFRIFVDVYIDEKPVEQSRIINYKPVKDDKKVIIVGFGPGGMFAALKLIEYGIKPIVLEECRNGTPDASNDPSVVRCLPCDFNCPE